MGDTSSSATSNTDTERKLSLEDRSRKAIEESIRKYRLAPNEQLLTDFQGRSGLPTRATKKLAFLVAAYKREATVDLLKSISDQPAGIVRSLRKDGFVFQDDGRTNPNYQFINSQGAACRKIIDYIPASRPPRGWAKELLNKSIAAAVSSIEIYNKPDFQYREETFSILLVNAWELLAKARILQKSGGRRTSIYVKGANGKVKLSQAGNQVTLGIAAASKKLVADGDLDERCNANLRLLIEIRDNSVHFMNKDLNFVRRIQEIGSAALRNYLTALTEWFGIDLSTFDFFLMPISFYPPAELVSSTSRPNQQMQNLVEHLLRVQGECSGDENGLYSVALSIQVRFTRSSADSDIAVRWTGEQDAPAFTVTEEDRIRRQYPLTYADVVNGCRSKYHNFKKNRRFNAIMKDLQNRDLHGEKYCTVRYLDLAKKTGSQKTYYSSEIYKVLQTKYT